MIRDVIDITDHLEGFGVIDAPQQSGSRWPSFLDVVIGRLSAIEFSPLLLVAIPLLVAAGRGAAEMLIAPTRGFSVPLLNYVLCYSLLQLAMIGVLAATTRTDYRRVTGLASAGLLLGWLPPLIDTPLRLLGLEQGGAWYLYPRGLDFDFFAPYELVGESITLWLAIALTGLAAGWISRSWGRALVATLLAYLAIQVVACVLPAAAGLIRDAATDMRRHVPLNWIYLAAIGLLYVTMNRRTTVPSLRRVAHALPWGLLVVVGAQLADRGWDVAVNRGLVMALAAQLAIFANDYFDQEMDGLAGGRARPVTRDDLVFVIFLHVLLVAQAYAVERRAAVYPVTFITIWAIYHLPTIRAKRVFGVPYFCEGIGAALCVLYGMYSTRGARTDLTLVFLAAGLAFFGFLIGSALKDYKDIPQDRAAGIETVYTLLIRRGMSLPWVHRLVSMSVTLLLLAPILTLAALGYRGLALMIPALLGFAPALFLLSLQNRLHAVEAALWGLSAYLLILALAIRMMGVVL